MDICIDFDATCVTDEFPKIGKSIRAEKVLKLLVENGHRLILFTMRSNKKDNKSSDPDIQNIDGDFLDHAVEWFKKNDIPLYGIQTNPTQYKWTESPKAYGHLYIDDASLGCPLKYDIELSARPFVDWEEVERLLRNNGIIK